MSTEPRININLNRELRQAIGSIGGPERYAARNIQTWPDGNSRSRKQLQYHLARCG